MLISSENVTDHLSLRRSALAALLGTSLLVAACGKDAEPACTGIRIIEPRLEEGLYTLAPVLTFSYEHPDAVTTELVAERNAFFTNAPTLMNPQPGPSFELSLGSMPNEAALRLTSDESEDPSLVECPTTELISVD